MIAVQSRIGAHRADGAHRARKERPTLSGRYDSPLAPERIAAVKDEDIDFGDIPELDEDFWKRAELVEPDRTDQVTIRVKRSVLAYFKAPVKGYQTRMNRVLESYVRHRMGDSASTGEGADAKSGLAKLGRSSAGRW